jgi:hypothetical protein
VRVGIPKPEGMVLTRKEKIYRFYYLEVRKNVRNRTKISLDKGEIIYIINNAIISLFEN